MDYSKYFNAVEEHNVYYLRVPKNVTPPAVNDILLINGQKFKVKYLSTPEDIMKGRGGPVGKSMIENGIGWDVKLEKLAGDNMKHIAKIQTEFLKEARDWDKLSLEEQKAYLQRHPSSKRRLTAKPAHRRVKDADRIYTTAQRLTKLKDVGEGYDKFFDRLKEAYPSKSKLIDKLQFKIDDANSINYMAKHDSDSKSKTPEQKEQSKEIHTKLLDDIKNIVGKIVGEEKKSESSFNEGQKVRLKPNKEEGWPEQFGKVLEVQPNGTITVELDKKYRDDADDDGLREVTDDQLENRDIEEEQRKQQLRNRKKRFLKNLKLHGVRS